MPTRNAPCRSQARASTTSSVAPTTPVRERRGRRPRQHRPNPLTDLYNICYVNGFQTQPGEGEAWLAEHPDLVLRDASGAPFVDPGWPDEYLLDTSTEEKRAGIEGQLSSVLSSCADKGFDAVEIDNLDAGPGPAAHSRSTTTSPSPRTTPSTRTSSAWPSRRRTAPAIPTPARPGRLRLRGDRGVHAIRRVRRLSRRLRRPGVRHRVRVRGSVGVEVAVEVDDQFEDQFEDSGDAAWQRAPTRPAGLDDPARSRPRQRPTTRVTCGRPASSRFARALCQERLTNSAVSSQPSTAWVGMPSATTGKSLPSGSSRSPTKTICSSGMPVSSASRRIPYALSMPRRVMSMLVDPPEPHLELGQQRLDGRTQRVLLLTGRIPRLLCVDRRRLPERGEGDLRSTVLQDRSPGVGLPEPQPTCLRLDSGECPARWSSVRFSAYCWCQSPSRNR